MQQDDRIFAAVGACVIVGIALAAAVMWLASGITVEAPQRAAVEVKELEVPTSVTAGPSNQNVVEASLVFDDDDGVVRSAVARLSNHPRLASYLVNDRLLRRFVMTVDAIAGGYNPRDEIEFMRPTSAFVVREHEDRLVIAAGSFRRYSVIADTFASLDTNGSVELYRQFRPRLEEIYREIGWADDSFDDRFRAAVDHLLEVEVPNGPIDVEQSAIVYVYAEDEYESLTGAQKLLVRMGRDNARTIQRKLFDFREAVGWPITAKPVVTAELELPERPEISDELMVAEAASILPANPIEERAGAPEAP